MLLVRQVPRHLSVKVRRYYEYYYTQAAVFEEAEILDPLPPILHNDVVSFVTQVTLLKVPLFKRLDPTIYKYILPLLKPLSLSPNDDVYVRGQESANLCFLKGRAGGPLTDRRQHHRDPHHEGEVYGIRR